MGKPLQPSLQKPRPGGWIEQIEPNINFYCDDGTQPADTFVGSWGSTIGTAFAKTGKDVHTEASFKDRITAAGFTNLHEKIYKVPCGDWAKNPLLKEAGKFEKMQVLSRLEGYAMFTLTKFGDPQPWSPDEVLVYVAKVRKEMVSGGFHSYFRMRRIWAQKPFDTEPAAEKPEVVV